MKTTITLELDHKKNFPLLSNMVAQRAYSIDGVSNATVLACKIESFGPPADPFLTSMQTMVKLQDRLNAVINPEWITAGYPWHRAIMVEGVELLEHVGWKWWKKQEPNIAQAKMELVDIWHFIMSQYIVNEGDLETAARVLADGFGSPTTVASGSMQQEVDVLVGDAGDNCVNEVAFRALMQHLGLTWDELYTTYIAKNVLNIFRQDHGYRAGSYKKDWNGMEDNEVLHVIMASQPDAAPEQLYAALELRYEVLA